MFPSSIFHTGMNEIFKVADEISVLRDGKMVITGKTKNLDMKMLIDYMIGKTLKKQWNGKNARRRSATEVLLKWNIYRSATRCRI